MHWKQRFFSPFHFPHYKSTFSMGWDAFSIAFNVLLCVLLTPCLPHLLRTHLFNWNTDVTQSHRRQVPKRTLAKCNDNFRNRFSLFAFRMHFEWAAKDGPGANAASLFWYIIINKWIVFIKFLHTNHSFTHTERSACEMAWDTWMRTPKICSHKFFVHLRINIRKENPIYMERNV